MLNDLLQSRAMSKAASVAYFSQMDLMVNVLTIGSQFFGTKRLLNAVGFRATLLFVPLLSLFAFVAAPVLSNTDTLLLFVAGVHVARRAGNCEWPSHKNWLIKISFHRRCGAPLSRNFVGVSSGRSCKCSVLDPIALLNCARSLASLRNNFWT